MSEAENHACLVVADESEEFPNALVYAGLRPSGPAGGWLCCA